MAVTLEFLTEQLELGDELRTRRATMFQPQDLPGRYGRVVKAIDRVLEATGADAVMAGGWAVWNHGYVGRLTQDVDIVLSADKVDAFLHSASVCGFEVMPRLAGRWPKLRHKETNIEVDILPEGGRPGTASDPAPTTIRRPSEMGAEGKTLRYITLPALIELKVAAGRGRDDGDVIELVRANPSQVAEVRAHLEGIHPSYVEMFDRLAARARQQEEK